MCTASHHIHISCVVVVLVMVLVLTPYLHPGYIVVVVADAIITTWMAPLHPLLSICRALFRACWRTCCDNTQVVPVLE